MKPHELETIFNRFYSPGEAEQARNLAKATGKIKLVSSQWATSEGFRILFEVYSDGSIEVKEYLSLNNTN
jgi:hypothetical protein